MKRWAAPLTLALAAWLAPPAAAQDSVVGSGFSGPGDTGYSFTIDAQSGPSGESPSGSVLIDPLMFNPLTGPVTCLAVRGNAATLNFVAFPSVLTVSVIDSPTGDRISLDPDVREPADCTALSTPPSSLVEGAGVVVTDAAPPVVSRRQARAACKRERRVIGKRAFRAKYGVGRHHRRALRTCVGPPPGQYATKLKFRRPAGPAGSRTRRP
jgi:hypothetical protein